MRWPFCVRDLTLLTVPSDSEAPYSSGTQI